VAGVLRLNPLYSKTSAGKSVKPLGRLKCSPGQVVAATRIANMLIIALAARSSVKLGSFQEGSWRGCGCFARRLA
jgi:hypothetical protein